MCALTTWNSGDGICHWCFLHFNSCSLLFCVMGAVHKSKPIKVLIDDPHIRQSIKEQEVSIPLSNYVKRWLGFWISCISLKTGIAWFYLQIMRKNSTHSTWSSVVNSHMISIDKGMFPFLPKKQLQKVCKYLFLRNPFIFFFCSKITVMGLQKKMINEPKEPGLKLSHCIRQYYYLVDMRSLRMHYY